MSIRTTDRVTSDFMSENFCGLIIYLAVNITQGNINFAFVTEKRMRIETKQQ